MPLAIKSMGGESEAAWRQLLDDLTARGMAKPELVVVDGGKGLEAAVASLWTAVPVHGTLHGSQGAQPPTTGRSSGYAGRPSASNQ